MKTANNLQDIIKQFVAYHLNSVSYKINVSNLYHFFKNVDYSEINLFFNKLLPKLAEIALDLPTFFPHSLKILK